MSSLCESIHDAVAERDVPLLYSLMVGKEFILLSNSKDEQDQHDGAFIAEIDEMEALMVFTEDSVARKFVDEAGAALPDDEEVDGIYIEGLALIHYLPEEFGIMLDAECDHALIIEPEIMRNVKKLAEEKNSDTTES